MKSATHGLKSSNLQTFLSPPPHPHSKNNNTPTNKTMQDPKAVHPTVHKAVQRAILKKAIELAEDDAKHFPRLSFGTVLMRDILSDKVNTVEAFRKRLSMEMRADNPSHLEVVAALYRFWDPLVTKIGNPEIMKLLKWLTSPQPGRRHIFHYTPVSMEIVVASDAIGERAEPIILNPWTCVVRATVLWSIKWALAEPALHDIPETAVLAPLQFLWNEFTLSQFKDVTVNVVKETFAIWARYASHDDKATAAAILRNDTVVKFPVLAFLEQPIGADLWGDLIREIVQDVEYAPNDD